MTPALRMVDRFLTLLLAAILLGGATWLIGYGSDAHFARRAAVRVDPHAIGRVPDWPWWPALSGTVGVLVALLGLWLVLLHLRPRTVRTLQGPSGAVNLARVAHTAAEDLDRHPAVQFAKGITRSEGSRPIVRVTVGVAPSTPIAEVRRLARHCRADVQRAAATDIEFQMLVERVAADKTRPRVM